MSEELTAIQMLIEAMQKDYDSIDGSESYIANVQKSEIGLRILQAKSLLKKEQEQIEKAFDSGYSDGIVDAIGLDKYKDANGIDYYQYKYGGENEN